MKNLELNRMESFNGGSSAGNCVAAVAGGVDIIVTTATIIVAGATPLGWLALGLGAIAMAGGTWDGDPCEEFAG